ncbi:MAG: tetratricopeptide repeat protein [Gammaproteobacteria bacterium]
MSLLMDALRRAEADKKAQEERAAQASLDGGAITRISPFAKSEDDTVQIDGLALQAAAAAHDERHEPALELEDYLAPPPAAEFSLAPLELAEEAYADEAFSAEDPGRVSTGYTTHAGRVERREDTGTLSSARGMRHDVDDYLDRSHSMEVPRVPSRSNDGTLDDVVAHTVASAQTVFRASDRPRHGRVVTVAASIAVCVVLAIVGVGVYYASLAPRPRPVPSPGVARDVEKPPEPPSAFAPDGGLARVDTTPPPEASPAVTAGAPMSPPMHASEASPLPSDLPVAAPPPDAAPVVAATAPPVATPPVARPRPAMARPSIHDEELGNGQVRIARSRGPNAVDAALAAGYAALQRGDVEGAAAQYQRARAQAPERRDTLLGLAAVAQRRGDRNRAAEYYAEVLRRQPDDPVASAALLSLTATDGEAGAARLRLLLDRNGDAAYLHAALGQWYARAGRWADAQQAYFDAARLDAANADYAFNLAVSLERLGQGRVALAHYQQALALRALRGAAFDPAIAAARVSALGGAVTP